MVIELVQVGFSQQLPQKLVMTFQFHEMVLATCSNFTVPHCLDKRPYMGLRRKGRGVTDTMGIQLPETSQSCGSQKLAACPSQKGVKLKSLFLSSEI
jgi:hypothetical protein